MVGHGGDDFCVDFCGLNLLILADGLGWDGEVFDIFYFLIFLGFSCEFEVSCIDRPTPSKRCIMCR